MRNVAAAITVCMLCGCAHADSGHIANTLMTAAIIAVEVSVVTQSAAPGPLCADEDPGPPHTCPGTTPSPVSPPPPPPD